MIMCIKRLIQYCITLQYKIVGLFHVRIWVLECTRLRGTFMVHL